MPMRSALSIAALVTGNVAAAPPIFIFTEGARIIVADAGGIRSESPLSFEMAALFVVPDNVNIAGAGPGDVLGTANQGELYRINDPLGAPSLELLGVLSQGAVDFTFSNEDLYGVGRESGTIVVRLYDTSTLEVVQTFQTGIDADGFGGLAWSHQEQAFFLTEKNVYDALFRWTPGSSAVRVCAPSFSFGNNDLEQGGDAIYAAFASAGQLRVGPLHTDSCAFEATVSTGHTSGNVIGLAVLFSPCPADLNGDSRVDTQDFISYLNAWAAGQHPADWNDDGAVDTRDFLAYLTDWAAGCD